MANPEELVATIQTNLEKAKKKAEDRITQAEKKAQETLAQAEQQAKELLTRTETEVAQLRNQVSPPPTKLEVDLNVGDIKQELSETRTSFSGWVQQIIAAIRGIEIPSQIDVKEPSWIQKLIPRAISLKGIEQSLDRIKSLLEELKSKESKIEYPEFPEFPKFPELPREASDPIAVRLSNGKEFIEQITKWITTGGNSGGSFRETIPTDGSNNQVNVTTAGTKKVLGDISCVAVTIKAKSTNTGLIYVGFGAVSATNGHILAASESVALAIDNIAKIFIDSSVSGEGVSYLLVRE